jgi:LPXTG-motif cell wall-anchored protein
MTKLRFLGAAIALAAFTTAVNADTWSKKTKVTFSGPVQIPGPNSKNAVITLPAGSYIFRLLDSSSNRHVVQVTNLRGDHVYSTILALNDYRLNASSKTVMYFTESKSGSPPPVKAWFYPGDNYGQRFVYPKAQAAQIAATVNQPVPAHDVQVVEVTKVVEVPVYIETPAKQETAYRAEDFDKHDATDTAGVDGEAVKDTPAPAAAPAKLPKTASSLQLMGFMGALLLGVSFLLRRVSMQVK